MRSAMPPDGQSQAKWIHAGSGEPPAADIGTFANGVRDVIEENAANFGQRLQAKLGEVSRAIMVPGATLVIVLITTGASELARHGTANLDRILSELNEPSDQEPIATHLILGLEEVYGSLASITASAGISITANITEWSYVSQPYGAYFGIIDGLQLKEWWDIYGKRLVAKNIRYALGTTDINDGIRATAKSSPEDFWYFNNGITLIADEVIRAPKAAASRASGIFEFKGTSIVNGAQTVSTLGRVESDESLGRVKVPIRIVILADAPANFGGEVTRTNNLQNRVEGRDFVAQDTEQTRLQQEMSMEGVEYQFLRSEDFTSSPHACELLEVTTALACASADPTLAVQVKTGIGRFFIDLKKAPYKSVFNPQTSGARAFNSTLIHRTIDTWIEEKRESIGKRSGYPWGVLIHGNRILAAGVFKLLGRPAIDRPIEDFRMTMPQLSISVRCEAIYSAIVDALETQYPGKFLAVLFKSPSMSKDVFDRAVAAAQVSTAPNAIVDPVAD